MKRLALSFTIRDYERTSPLIAGQVPVEGIDPLFVPFEIDNFRRMLNHLEYDVSEMSMSSYLIAREQGIPVIALPIFPHRRFRHSFIFVHSGGSVNEPAELVGKRVGIPEYQITALVWIRGILEHDYGVKPHQVKWFTDREEERLEVELPKNVHVEKLPPRSKEKLFLEGKLDAIADGKVPGIFLEGDKRIRRLFQNFREVEGEYYRRTGIFPIMHTVVVKKKVYDANPWVAESVWKAFVQSKYLSYKRMDDPRLSNLIWPQTYLDEERQTFGADPWKYSVRENLKALETLVQYELEQGLITKEQHVDDLFAPNSYDLVEGKHQPYDL